ncbi:MAG: GNAT family N-acetyltransferase [Bulleidia sp.]
MRTLQNLFTDDTSFSHGRLTYHILCSKDTQSLKTIFEQPLSDVHAEWMMRTLMKKRERGEMLCYGVFLEDELIGVVEVYDIHPASFEIGYRVSPAWRSRGFGTAMVMGFLSHVQDVDLTRIRARVRPDNTASIRILENNGFEMRERTDSFCLYEVKP